MGRITPLLERCKVSDNNWTQKNIKGGSAMDEEYITLFVAVISALSALYGYIYVKRKEREFELAKIRQDIYEKFISLYYQGQRIFAALLADTNAPKQPIAELYAYAHTHYPEFTAHISEYLKVNTLLCVYGPDDAVKASAAFSREAALFAQGLSQSPPDIAALVLSLRKNVYSKQSNLRNTTVTRDEIAQLMTP